METQIGLSVKRMSKLQGKGTTKAFCDLEVAETLLIKGFRVIEGKNGLFVGMPREQGKDGNWYDTVTPVNKEAKRYISELVLDAYEAGEAAPVAH